MFVSIPKIVKRGFPILVWYKDYNVDTAVADLVAGITVGLTLIPQVIAYASLAGLEPQYGLYSSLCGGIIYAILGGVPELNIAPTALLSLLTFSFTQKVTFGHVNAAILLCFVSGIVELICGGLHLGFLVDFVSTPVVAAFTSAGAITIASSQVKSLLGLQFTAEGFTSVWINVYRHITEVRKWDAILGLCCCIILLSMRKLKDFGRPPLDNNAKSSDEKNATIRKLIWFCSVARNAFVVIGSATLAYILGYHDLIPFDLTSKVPQGLPKVGVPINSINTGNITNATPIDMIQELGMGNLVLPFVGILSNVAIAKAFAKGKVVDASQEMIALGTCNLIGSFLGSYPVCASFSRAAVSNASGVRTPLAGLYTAAMVILALTFLTPYFPYIPKATLSAVIICAVIFMVEVTLTKTIWNVNKLDLVPFVVTLLSCLFLGIEMGILVGICVDVVFLLHTLARPNVLIEKMSENDTTPDWLKITPTSALLFPSAEFVREKIMKSYGKYDFSYKMIVVDCQRISRMDFTAAKCLAAFVQDFNKLGKIVVFYRPSETIAKMIRHVSGAEIIKTLDYLSDICQGSNRHLQLNSRTLETPL